MIHDYLLKIFCTILWVSCVYVDQYASHFFLWWSFQNFCLTLELSCEKNYICYIYTRCQMFKHWEWISYIPNQLVVLNQTRFGEHPNLNVTSNNVLMSEELPAQQDKAQTFLKKCTTCGFRKEKIHLSKWKVTVCGQSVISFNLCSPLIFQTLNVIHDFGVISVPGNMHDSET